MTVHVETFGIPPEQASADRGLYSADNEQFAKGLGVKHVVLSKHAYISKGRRELERQEWFVEARKWHAGVEGRISVLKRAHGLRRCIDRVFSGFQRRVAWSVTVGNLAVMGRA